MEPTDGWSFKFYMNLIPIILSTPYMVLQNELACFMLIGGEVLSTPDLINHWAVGFAYHHMWGNPVETPVNQPRILTRRFPLWP